MADDGILLLKYWLEVGAGEQTRRLQSCINDPRRSGSCRTWTCGLEVALRRLNCAAGQMPNESHMTSVGSSTRK